MRKALPTAVCKRKPKWSAFFEQHPNFPLINRGKVHIQRIREIFIKPIYAGFIDIPDWGLSLIKGHHEPLISFEAFQRIQDTLTLFRELLQEAWDQRTEMAKTDQSDLKTTLTHLERKTQKVMERLVETDDPTLITAYEAQIRKLQEDKLLIEEKLQKPAVNQGTFEETYRTAMEFRSNPCNLWDNVNQESRKLVLKLAFYRPHSISSKWRLSNRSNLLYFQPFTRIERQFVRDGADGGT